MAALESYLRQVGQERQQRRRWQQGKQQQVVCFVGPCGFCSIANISSFASRPEIICGDRYAGLCTSHLLAAAPAAPLALHQNSNLPLCIRSHLDSPVSRVVESDMRATSGELGSKLSQAVAQFDIPAAPDGCFPALFTRWSGAEIFPHLIKPSRPVLCDAGILHMMCRCAVVACTSLGAAVPAKAPALESYLEASDQASQPAKLGMHASSLCTALSCPRPWFFSFLQTPLPKVAHLFLCRRDALLFFCCCCCRALALGVVSKRRLYHQAQSMLQGSSSPSQPPAGLQGLASFLARLAPASWLLGGSMGGAGRLRKAAAAVAAAEARDFHEQMAASRQDRCSRVLPV